MRTGLEPPRRSHSLFLSEKRLEHSPRLLSVYENGVGTSSFSLSFSLSQKRLEHPPRLLSYENGVETSSSFSLSFSLSEEAGAFSSSSVLL